MGGKCSTYGTDEKLIARRRLRLENVVVFEVKKFSALTEPTSFFFFTLFTNTDKLSHLEPSWISWLFKMGPTRCPETSLRNYHHTPRNILEERRSGLNRGGSLKSQMNRIRKSLFFSNAYILLTASLSRSRTVCTSIVSWYVQTEYSLKGVSFWVL